MNPATALATVLVDELARCGLAEAVVAPGSRNAPLAMALWEQAARSAGRLRLHVRIDERSAAFLALGLAKLSRRPVAVVCTSGTAAAHFHARGDRGRRGGRPAARPHRRPPAGAAWHRREPDGGPAEAVRGRGALVLRGRRAGGAAGDERLLALPGLPRLGVRRRGGGHHARAGPPEPVACASRSFPMGRSCPAGRARRGRSRRTTAPRRPTRPACRAWRLAGAAGGPGGEGCPGR